MEDQLQPSCEKCRRYEERIASLEAQVAVLTAKLDERSGQGSGKPRRFEKELPSLNLSSPDGSLATSGCEKLTAARKAVSH